MYTVLLTESGSESCVGKYTGYGSCLSRWPDSDRAKKVSDPNTKSWGLDLDVPPILAKKSTYECVFLEKLREIGSKTPDVEIWNTKISCFPERSAYLEPTLLLLCHRVEFDKREWRVLLLLYNRPVRGGIRGSLKETVSRKFLDLFITWSALLETQIII